IFSLSRRSVLSFRANKLLLAATAPAVAVVAAAGPRHDKPLRSRTQPVTRARSLSMQLELGINSASAPGAAMSVSVCVVSALGAPRTALGHSRVVPRKIV